MADPAAAGPAPLLEAPTPPSARRQRQPIITLRMDEVEEELQQRKAGTPRRRAGAPRPAVPESLLRFVSFCRFCWTCATGACASLVRG